MSFKNSNPGQRQTVTRGNKTPRTQLNVLLPYDVVEQLDDYSEVTRTPIVRVVELALLRFLNAERAG